MSLEDSAANDSLRIFTTAAYYALTEEEISEIMEADEITLNLYDKNLVIAAIRVYKYEAADAARKVFQDEDDEESTGALVQNYDLMLHYRIGHLRRADCAYHSSTSLQDRESTG